MIAISGTNLRMDPMTVTESGLYTFGTISDAGDLGSGIPTTASIFALNCKIIDLSTGYVYKNLGTVAAPVWLNTDTQMVSVSLTAANLIAMYTTPVAILPALPGRSYVVDSVEFVMTRTATAFTSGGVVALQYDSTANGAGTATHATIAASVVTGASGTTYTTRIPVVQSDIASASIVGKGLYISNATAAFATGTGTAVMKVRFHVL